MLLRYGLILLLIIVSCQKKENIGGDESDIQVLILSGRNNHEWQKTTPQLIKIYEDARIFQSTVTESPDTLVYEDYRQFDVIISNFSAWPAHEYRWSEMAEEGLIRFVEEGGGFVLFHAASATFYDWPEYQQMIGSTWGDSTRHGDITPHKVVIKDQEHPITEGISDFWITDELWVNGEAKPDIKVLAESYSDPTNQGRGVYEPVVHWRQMGQGRIFHNVLGHNERAMKNTGWKTLMLRGTEWAARGEVSIKVSQDLMKEKAWEADVFSWQETDTTLALLNHGNIVWQYNFKTIKGKPFFHPVNVRGRPITWLSPEDHPWHLGIWHSWKFINGVNYWEYDRSEGVPPFSFLGITDVRHMAIEKQEDYTCKFYLDISYHEKEGADLLGEKREIVVSRPDRHGQFYIDYLIDMSSLQDQVELSRTPLPHEKDGQTWGGYAGLSVRFSQDVFDPQFINADGSDQMDHGIPMPWKYYGLKDLQGEKLGAAIFCHKGNLNYPESWFVTDYEDHPFYYFSPAPLFNQPHILNLGDQLNFGYRIQFYSSEVSPDLLSADYKRYLEKNETE